ncbi:MAG TPA: hypothetical protein VGX23_20005 [Actinocrinis sp.]|nr:hypothetical protein [Actinocrinis sp.]
MSNLAASISRILDGEGVLADMLVDATTGLVYGAAGDSTILPEPEEATEAVRGLVERLHDAGADGELEGVIVTTTRYHQLTQVVPRHRGDDLLFVAVADRARTNIALAERAVVAQVGTVLA